MAAAPLFALVDCNNFYASCEKLFAPKLAGRPVVVLSNNDGCIVARSAEAKALGIGMGLPWFKIAASAESQGVVALSSNYALYADMSNRVVEVLSAFTPDLEVYSIDESFLDLSGFRHLDLLAYAQQIRQRVGRWIGLPVCVGIGPTKTLAKLANHFAKKGPAFGGVCDLASLDEATRSRLFSETPIDEVWGVGRRIASRLSEMGIETVEALRRSDPDWIREQFSVVLSRTVRELNGVSCLSLETVTPPKQQIMASRSFGNLVFDIEDLREALAHHVSRAAEKLRSQGDEAGALTVMIRTNPFKPTEPQYQRTVTLPLATPTSDTLHLIVVAHKILDDLFRPGFAYHKAGVMLSELRPATARQADLFGVAARDARRQATMQVMDEINRKWGRGTVRTSAAGHRAGWQMRRERLSPAYTTSWTDLPTAFAV
ncbi:DNA polymerase V catalytic protein [Thauera humireducens]|uniref:Y-family DNA polymerase n=1 Tax=Thauera humireducens TaxID=1134435 RepID=UPI002467AAAA|nr:Y-family DNA polymerase [Thauera humireducens]CAH1748228.1 DNA polymerase V catalytic protein [Thauera humireducens]